MTKQSRRLMMAEETKGKIKEAVGDVTGDKTMETEGRVERRKGQKNTYRVVSNPNNEGWKVELEESGQVSSVHRTKEEALRQARELAKAHQPSQVLVYKQDGTAQTDHTYS
jgi:Uncharacterized protein conserved in bacteria (DUF2188)